VAFYPFLGSGQEWYQKSNSKNEVRNEIFKPPYLSDEKNMPAVTKVGDNIDPTAVVTSSYGAELTIEYEPRVAGNTVNVTSVTLVAPSAVTHGFNNNQRVVICEILEATPSSSVTVRLPPSPLVAPPQMYMLFLNNAKTYSRAWWVQLERPEGTKPTFVAATLSQ
jgi:hypothetical protein